MTDFILVASKIIAEGDDYSQEIKKGFHLWKESFEEPSSVQSLSRVQVLVTPWTGAHQASLSITNHQSLLKFMSIASVMPSNHLILCYPFPSAFNLSQHQALFQ